MQVTPKMLAKEIGVTEPKLRRWLRTLERFQEPKWQRNTRYFFEPSDPVIEQAKSHFGSSVKAGKGSNR